MKRFGLLALALALAGCGAARDLQPRRGVPLPPAPRGADETPTAGKLLAPTTQQRPQRSDELLTQSDERRQDEFDLPPD